MFLFYQIQIQANRSLNKNTDIAFELVHQKQYQTQVPTRVLVSHELFIEMHKDKLESLLQ